MWRRRTERNLSERGLDKLRQLVGSVAPVDGHGAGCPAGEPIAEGRADVERSADGDDVGDDDVVITGAASGSTTTTWTAEVDVPPGGIGHGDRDVIAAWCGVGPRQLPVRPPVRDLGGSASAADVAPSPHSNSTS